MILTLVVVVSTMARHWKLLDVPEVELVVGGAPPFREAGWLLAVVTLAVVRPTSKRKTRITNRPKNRPKNWPQNWPQNQPPKRPWKSQEIVPKFWWEGGGASVGGRLIVGSRPKNHPKNCSNIFPKFSPEIASEIDLKITQKSQPKNSH